MHRIHVRELYVKATGRKQDVTNITWKPEKEKEKGTSESDVHIQHLEL